MGATCSIAEAKIEYCFQTIPQLMADLRNLRTVVASLQQTSAVVADVNKIELSLKNWRRAEAALGASVKMSDPNNCHSFVYMANVLYEYLLKNPDESYRINTDIKLGQTLKELMPSHIEDEFWFDYNMNVFKLCDFRMCVLSARRNYDELKQKFAKIWF